MIRLLRGLTRLLVKHYRRAGLLVVSAARRRSSLHSIHDYQTNLANKRRATIHSICQVIEALNRENPYSFNGLLSQ